MAATVKGTANAVLATSVTIPSHAVGDLIVIFAYTNGINSAPTAPSASGTVPAWTLVQGGGGNTNGSGAWYFIATATNHTSGTWANSTGLTAVVIEDVSTASPIGGFAQANANSTLPVAPAITLTNSSGSSCLLYFYGHRNCTAWGSAPTGFTRRAAVAGTSGLCLNTKDDTTTAGSASQTDTGSGGYRGQTIEILAATGSTTELTPAAATIAITGTAPTLVTTSVLTPAAAPVTVTGTAPKLENTVSPPGGSLTGALITITGTAPTLTMSLVTTGATITITGGTPSSAGEAILTPAAATVTVTGTAPKLLMSVVPGSETLPVTGGTPVLIAVTVLSPAAAPISVTGGTPVVILPITLQPSAAPITVTGSNPTITVGIVIAPTPDEDHLLLVRREKRILSLEGSRVHTMGRFKQVVDA